ncbi:MAG: UDP-3-O-(3-hydroxymyristoyl)glucosamine N-acyltransferase [Bdellovibrionota bacterium]|nr:MAG: UDP-3-O-(3-hydroxymyristoyl)glucosamine N-acyltransferase [Bdellovibrionota bacterium]
MTHPVPLSELAKRVHGSIRGDGSTSIHGVCPLDQQEPGFLAFLREEKQSIAQSVADTLTASALMVSKKCVPASSPVPLLVVENPLLSLRSILDLFHPPASPAQGIHPLASVDPTARIGKNVSIGPFSVVGSDVQIEDEVTIHPHVVLYAKTVVGRGSILHAGVVVREGCRIGPHNTVQPGAVIGADGFGYVLDPQLGLVAIPQVGNVVLDANVDVGANSCIDRGTLGSTAIAQGAKLDNLVQVGHNVRIGSHAILCGQSGVAGSSTIGNGAVLGGQSGVADHLTIGDGVRLGAQAGAVSDLRERGDYLGFPAQPAMTFRRMVVALRRLPALLKDLK